MADQKEVMVLGLRPQVLEDRLLPVTLHMVPVVDHTVANGVVDAIAGCLGIRQCFVADKEIEVFDASFRCKAPGLCWDRRSSTCCLGSRTTRGYRGRKYALQWSAGPSRIHMHSQ